MRSPAPNGSRPSSGIPLPTSAYTRLDANAVFALASAVVAVVLALWVRHGGFSDLSRGAQPVATSLTKLTGLAASFAGLGGLVLAGRPVALERRYGLDRLFIFHRILGETMALLVGAHVVAGVFDWGITGGYWSAIVDVTGRQTYMALATVGALIIGAVTISSLRSIRRRLSYEAWYFMHLLAYAGLAISFSHEIVWGGTFSDDWLARWIWIGLHIGIAAVLVRGRWGRLIDSIVRPLRVGSRRVLNDESAEIRLVGSVLRSRTGDAGQFVFIRPLVRGLWWQAHPFSLSGAPTTGGMQISVKALGDASTAIANLPVGTKVAVEGPFGACTTDVIGDDRVLFVVGGIGVTPVMAMLERLGRHHRPIVLYRASREEDLVYLSDLERLTAERGGEVMTLVGPTARLAIKDPFSSRVLRSAIPDVANRVAVLCGPERLLWAARAGLKDAGVPPSRIHFERPWW